MISYEELNELYEKAKENEGPDIVITRTKEDADWLREMYPDKEEKS